MNTIHLTTVKKINLKQVTLFNDTHCDQQVCSIHVVQLLIPYKVSTSIIFIIIADNI